MEKLKLKVDASYSYRTDLDSIAGTVRIRLEEIRSDLFEFEIATTDMFPGDSYFSSANWDRLILVELPYWREAVQLYSDCMAEFKTKGTWPEDLDQVAMASIEKNRMMYRLVERREDR